MLCHHVQGLKNGRFGFNSKNLITLLADHISNSCHGCSPLVESEQSIDSFPFPDKQIENFLLSDPSTSHPMMPTRRLKDLLLNMPCYRNLPDPLRAEALAALVGCQVQVLVIGRRFGRFDELPGLKD